eukprot:3044659-Alexandrium_andersonii.AAC.1
MRARTDTQPHTHKPAPKLRWDAPRAPSRMPHWGRMQRTAGATSGREAGCFSHHGAGGRANENSLPVEQAKQSRSEVRNT